MNKTQALYRSNFGIRVKVPKQTFNIGSKIFIRKDQNPTNDPNHKYAPIATGSYNVTEFIANTCVILRENNFTERISLDCVVLAPQEHYIIVVEQETNKSRPRKVLLSEPDEYSGLSVKEEIARSPVVITRSMATKESRNDIPT